MWTLIWLALSALLVQAAHEPVNFTCVTDPPTTSMVAETVGSEVLLRVVHHNGLKYLPVYNGVVTPNDLHSLYKKGQTLAKMGWNSQLRLDLSRCRHFEGDTIVCHSREPQKVGELEIESVMLSTARIHTKAFGQEFEKTRINVSLRVGDELLDFSMNFQQGQCSDEVLDVVR